MRHYISKAIGIIALVCSFTPNVVAQQSIETDPFIQGAVNPDNWLPGGAYHSHNFPVRGSVVEQTGSVDVVPLYSQTLGNFKLQNADIHGNIGYIIDIAAHHPHNVHAPFDESVTSRASDRRDSPDGTQSSYDMRWSGTFIHPADGYDGPQGGGYPAPHRLGAVDLVSYNIEGIATGIYPLSQAEIQQRDVTRQSGYDASIDKSSGRGSDNLNRAIDHFADSFNVHQNYDPIDFGSWKSIAGGTLDFAGNSLESGWSVVKGSWNLAKVGVDSFDTGLKVVFRPVSEGLNNVSTQAGDVQVFGFRQLDIRSQYASLNALDNIGDAIGVASDAVSNTIESAIAEAYARYPEATTFVIEEGGYVVALTGAGKALGTVRSWVREGVGTNKPNIDIPQGLTARQFDLMSSAVRARADALGLGDDIFIQGSRAGGTARSDSDIDIAIRVSPEKFNEIINDPSVIRRDLLNPNFESAAGRTRQHIIERQRIHAGEANLSDLKNEMHRFGIDADVSIIMSGGLFDNDPQIPLTFRFGE